MFRLKNLFLTVALAFVAGLAYAGPNIAYSGPFIGTEGKAQVYGGASSKTFTRDMNTTGDRVAMQIVYSTYTVAVSTNFGSNNYTINTPTITVVGNKFTTGLQVLYSTGTVALSGLTNQTTYFISVINPNTLGYSNTFKLSSTLANAVAGTGIVLASSSTAANRYTLAPLAFTNVTGGIQVQYSVDGTNYSNLTTGNYNVTITSVTFAAAGASTIYDLGAINYRYLRLIVLPPLTGAVNYTVTDNERYSSPQ